MRLALGVTSSTSCFSALGIQPATMRGLLSAASSLRRLTILISVGVFTMHVRMTLASASSGEATWVCPASRSRPEAISESAMLALHPKTSTYTLATLVTLSQREG